MKAKGWEKLINRARSVESPEAWLEKSRKQREKEKPWDDRGLRNTCCKAHSKTLAAICMALHGGMCPMDREWLRQGDTVDKRIAKRR